MILIRKWPAAGVKPGGKPFLYLPGFLPSLPPKGEGKAEARPGHHSAIIQSLGGTSFDNARDAPHFRQDSANRPAGLNEVTIFSNQTCGMFVITMWSKPNENRCCC